MLQASPAAQNLVASCNGAKVSEEQLAIAAEKTTIGVKISTVAIKAFSIALNAIAYMAIIKGIQLFVRKLNELANAAEVASKKADELYSKSNSKVQQNKEELKSLDELILKYKDLKESGNLDIEDRKEVKELQNDIADLVGTQAKNLDLVNGKLDEEINKLNQISREESKRSYQNATANYYNAKDAANKSIGNSKVFFEDYDYAGKIEAKAKKVLVEAGFGVGDNQNRLSNPVYGGFGQDGIFSSKMVVKAIGDTAKEKYDYLQQMISVLEQNGQGNTDIYKGLVKQATEYDKYVQNEQNAINSLIDSWITYNQLSNKELSKITVDSVESFKEYRQKMINEAKSDESIGGMLADGILSTDKLETAINDFMATSEEFSDWYELWIEKTNGTAEENLTFKDKFQNLWDSDSFSDAKEDLAKLAKEAGITEKDIQSLASENAELASLLTESGMSAQFAATYFNKMSNGADGFSAITDDALALDKVLHGMDESLQSVAASKSAYDKAMEQDDYNSDFENYQAAYKDAMQMFEDGDYGRHFRSSMEYFLGEDSYTMSIEELYSAMKNLKSVFGEDATNGLEFVDKLYAKKDILDGMNSSLEKLSDGTYNVDLKPDEFEKIGEALGMTADEVAACTNALGMFGNYHAYDLEEVEKTLNGISIAAKNGEQSILSMQGVEKILSDIGYNGYEIYHIMQDIKGMDSIQLLDFSANDAESIQAVFDKLRELNAFEIGETSIDVSGLVTTMQKTLGMAAEDINTFLENIDGKFQFKDAEGSLVTLAQAKDMVLQAEDASASDGIDKIGEAAETTDEKVNTLHSDMESLNTLNLSGLMTRFHTAGTAVDNLNQKVQNLAAQMDAVNNKAVSAPNVSAGTASAPYASPAKPNTGKVNVSGNAQLGHSFSSGTIGAPKTETALINELGNETIIDPKSGTYEIVDGGAQFRRIKKGQIILNHLQTKALQKYGKISSFGKMLFGGNTDMKCSAYAGGIVGGINPATGKTYSKTNAASTSNAASKASAEAAKEAVEEVAEQTKEVSEEVFDWIERRIDKFRRKFDKWIKQAETAVTSVFITKYYKKAMSAITKELNTYGKAYNRYMKEANTVGLDATYAKKVRNGTIDIETIQDEELADKIQKYQEWYIYYAPLSGNRWRYSI